MSLWGAIAGAATGFITGGPAGAIVGAVAGYGGGSSPGTSMVPARPPGAFPIAPLPVPISFGGGGSGTMNQQADAWLLKQGIAPRAGSCPPGYHLNKHPLSPSKRHGALPARSLCVRNRHLNPLNPRALTKALKREKRARKLIGKLHVYQPVRSLTRSSGHRAGCRCAVCKRR